MAACLAAASIGTAEADDADAPISDPQKITTLMRGNTFHGVFIETGEPWVEFYCDSGRSLYDYKGRISLGKWWLDQSQICFSYDWSKYQHVQCFQMYAELDGSLDLIGISTYDGSLMTFHSAPPEAGDPFKLEKRAAYGCQLEPSV